MSLLAIISVAGGTGFLLGIRHAVDADHVVAVTTVIGENSNAWSVMHVGLLWGLGHALTLALVSLSLLLLEIPIHNIVEASFEGLVGIMLIVLGIKNWNLQPGHRHSERPSWLSAGVGAIHGLAGSAALVILLIATTQSTADALVYVGSFSIGSVLGMVLFSLIVTVPMGLANGQYMKWLRLTAGSLSVGLGIYLVIETLEVIA